VTLSRCGLVIGAIVPTAGASLLADIKTFQHLGEYAVPLTTGLTIQNLSEGLRSVWPYPPSYLEQQMEMVLADFPVQVVKVGAFLTKANGEYLYAALKEHFGGCPIVFDPVFRVSVNQGALVEADALPLFKHLCRIATVITPNLVELSYLLDRQCASMDDVRSCLSEMENLAPQAFWYVKGGHAADSDTIWDLVCYQGECMVLNHGTRLPYAVHGTGCTLASAISAFLLKYPDDPIRCFQAAFAYLHQQYATAYQVGEKRPFLISHT